MARMIPAAHGALDNGRARRGGRVERDEGFVFEPDLTGAHTIPARWYLDPAVLQREEERVFARTWQLVGPAARASTPGDYLTCQVGREPLVVTADEEGQPHAL